MLMRASGDYDGRPIAPMNEAQLRRWNEDGVLTCPHGKTRLQILELTPHWWVSSKMSSKGILDANLANPDMVSGEGEGVSPFWMACDCDRLTAFWPPVDMKIKWL